MDDKSPSISVLPAASSVDSGRELESWLVGGDAGDQLVEVVAGEVPLDRLRDRRMSRSPWNFVTAVPV
jgi:hypothetical protein